MPKEMNIKLIKILFSIFILGSVGSAYGMEFSFGHKQKSEADSLYRFANPAATIIYAEGDVDQGTTEKFKRFIDLAQVTDGTIVFNSYGGDLMEGIRLGKTIREHGFNTEVGQEGFKAGACASACVYAYAGGVARYFTKGSSLGLHQFTSNKGRLSSSETQEVSGLIVSFLSSMGIDPLVFSIASTVNHEGVVWLSEKQAKQVNLINDGVVPATAEIKFAQGIPYIVIDQDFLSNVANPTRLIVSYFKASNEFICAIGIVTNPTASRNMFNATQKSVLSTDFGVISENYKNSNKINYAGDVLWHHFKLTRKGIRKLSKSETISIDFETGGISYVGRIYLGDNPKTRKKFQDFVSNVVK